MITQNEESEIILTEMVKNCPQSQLNEKRTRFGRLCIVEISRIGSIGLREQTLAISIRKDYIMTMENMDREAIIIKISQLKNAKLEPQN
jgi:hypothetical protein